MTADDRARLETAESLLRAGRVGQAIADLRELTSKRPGLARAQELLAAALERSGDRVAAEASLRACLALDPQAASAATQLAIIVSARGSAPEAVALLEPFADSPVADVKLLTAYGAALKAVGRHDDAVAAYGRAVDAAPASAAAQHNLAGAFGEAHRFAESEASVRRAFEMGLDAPESWLILGRARMGQADFEGAETALRESIRRRPAYADAHQELAQLIWMRTEDVASATAALDLALLSAPLDARLSLAKAQIFEYAGEGDLAYAPLAEALSIRSDDVALQVGAALLLLSTDAETALAHAEMAYAVAPSSGPAAAALCQANLALGRADVAARIAERLCQDWPLDQYPVTLAATAWRLLGDARYGELYDYDRLVRAQTLVTPSGWANLDDYLRALAASLNALPRLPGHPVGQSLRNGAQTGQPLHRSRDPTISAFFQAIERPIGDYISVLSERDDVLGRRVSAGYRVTGAWSVRLRPGGHHVDHIHPMGWISSAFHVELPSAVDDGHQGWLKFGEPAMPTSPVLGPEHFVKPKAGDLVLFPSYMWHGTVPFGGESPRLAIAFDAVPA